MVGTTVIESPWTDDARAEAEALWELDQMTCPMCGNLREFCSDPNSTVYPQRHICYVSRDQAVADHQYGEKHKAKPYSDRLMKRWSEKTAPGTPYHFREGVRIYGADYDVNPDDHFI